MFPSWVLSLREGVQIEEGNGADFVLTGEYARLTIRRPARSAAAALRRLFPPGESIERLIRVVQDYDGPAAAATMCDWLRQIANRGYVNVSVHSEVPPLVTMEPISPAFRLPAGNDLPRRAGVLSRFAFVRRLGNVSVLESPLSPARVLIHDARAAAVIHALSGSDSIDVAKHIPGLSELLANRVIGLLAAAGMLTEAGERGTTEDENLALRTWEFHDLLFHSRSREGRHDAPFGAAYLWAGRTDAPPPLKPAESDDGIPLDTPNLEDAQRDEPSFASILDQRRSIREYGTEPLTKEQLGEFLYRAARVRDAYQCDVDTPGGPISMGFASRPYPAGGALYELELYPVIQQCRGLESGLYRYDPLRHRLIPVSGVTPDIERLFNNAGRSAGVPSQNLQVLLVLGSRFQRVAWKYASMAYALTLKNVGVLYQTMYLVATAMGLAPCALGAGDSDLFARAIGSDYYVESSVGEFLLGSRSAD